MLASILPHSCHSYDSWFLFFSGSPPFACFAPLREVVFIRRFAKALMIIYG